MLYLKSISPSPPPLSPLHDKHLAVWLFAPECEFDSCLKSLLFPLLYSLKLNCYPHIRENLICELSSHFSILWLVNIVGAVWISALNSRGKRQRASATLGLDQGSYNLKVKVKLLSRVWLFAAPWTVAHRASPSMGFSRQEYRSGLPFGNISIISMPHRIVALPEKDSLCSTFSSLSPLQVTGNH